MRDKGGENALSGIQPRDYDHLFKLLIIGDSGAGKSSLLCRFADDLFSDNFVTTIGVDFRIRSVLVNGERVKLQIWDTAGQERFRTITSTYYRGTHGVIIAYDVTSADSFANVQRWLEEAETNCEGVSKILVGTKDDDPSRKVVSHAEARKLADEMKIPFFETSAKENVGVEEAFMTITKAVLRSIKGKKMNNGLDTVNLRPSITEGGSGNSRPLPAKKRCC